MTSGCEVRARRVERRGVAGRSGADDDDVLDLVWAGAGHFTKYSAPIGTCVHALAAAESSLRLALLAPARHRAAQLEVGDRAGDRRQPEREYAVGQDGRHDKRQRHAERRERADHAAVDAADPARQRQQVAEKADEVAHDDHGQRRRVAEGVKARPQDGDVEGPVGDRAEQRGIALAHVAHRLAHARPRTRPARWPGAGRSAPADRRAARSPPGGAAGPAARATGRARAR